MLFRSEPEQASFPGMGKPKGKAPEAFSEEELAAQEEKPFATKLTADVLDQTGLPKQSGFYKQLLDMDMTDQNQWPAITNIFGKVRTNPNIKPATKQAIERIAMQAYGGIAKQQELFPEGKKGAKAEKPAKPAKEKVNEPAGGRDQNAGDVGKRTGTRAEGSEQRVQPGKSTEAATDTKRTEAPKPTGLGDRGQPVSDAGKREKVEPRALKEPKVESKAESKARVTEAKTESKAESKPASKKAKPSTENSYQTSVEMGEKPHAIRTLAADVYMAMMPEGYGAKRAATLIRAMREGKMPELKFGPLNANGPGTGGKYAKEFYESLDEADKAKIGRAHV